MPVTSYHSSFGGRGFLPPTVIEDPGSASHDGSNSNHASRTSLSSRHSQRSGENDGGSHSNSRDFGLSGSHGPPRMKRSPYLSAMSGSTKESEDLIALLSRPTTGADIGQRSGSQASCGTDLGLESANPEGSVGSVGKSDFFDLKRPAAPPEEPPVEAAKAPPRPLPSLRSSLRVPDAVSAVGGLKKNTSVTFSSATKQASQRGVNEALPGNARFAVGGPPQSWASDEGPSDYTAATMMRKSQSIASPQFSLAHQHALVAASGGDQKPRWGNDTLVEASREREGNASFPIYLGKLPDAQGGGGSAVEEARRALQNRCQSMSVLRPSTLDPGRTSLAHARPSHVKMNLTFREMLDEGDGKEGDMNVRSRNQRWKEFGTFSRGFVEEHSHMAGGRKSVSALGVPTMQEGEGDAEGATARSPHLSGEKRTLTPSSLTESHESGGSSNDTGFPRPARAVGAGRGLSGTHRATVSVSDLVRLRQSASRLKMSAPMAPVCASPAVVTSGGSAESVSLNTTAAGGGGGSFANSAAQRDLFFQKFGLPSQAARGGLGRRTQTVGAGLAYGRANMTTVGGVGGATRLSRFDLGDLRKIASQLSEISSQGSREGGGGRNEEWDLS